MINTKNFEKKSIVSILQTILYILICVIGFYVIFLIIINLLVKEQDKSFKNIVAQIKRLLGTISTQLSFLIISLYFGFIISAPLVYFAQNKGNAFANIILLILAGLMLWFYIKRIIITYKENNRFSKVVSSLFPKWFRFIFWIIFTLYLIPFSIGFSRINLILGILLIILVAFLFNALFYLDKVVDFIKKQKQIKYEKSK